MSSLPLRAGRRCHHALNALHSSLYFSPDLTRELAPFGVEDWSTAYFATRAAPLGAVGPGVVTATFYTFSHASAAQVLPGVWESVSPEAALGARLRAVDATMRRLLGEEALGAPEMAEAARLALRAAEGCTRGGRPVYAANADLPVPEAPHLAYWHAATLLREFRGDGHIALLQSFGLDPLEAIVSHTASGRGHAPHWVLRTRGHTEEDWRLARQRLTERGLLDEDGEPTAEGEELRRTLEQETDRLGHAPYEHLGAEGVERLTELAGGFAQTALAAGAFPADLFGKG